MEVFNNFGPITLAAPCGLGDTSITVTNATALSTVGNYRLLIDDEFMYATSRSGSVVQVTRAQEGSVAATHAFGVAVEPVLTAGAMAQFKFDVTTSGAALAGAVHQADGSAGAFYGPVNLNLGAAIEGLLPFLNGGRLQGQVSVVTGVPQTLNESFQVASCQTSGGATTVNMMASPVVELPALVFDDNNLAATNNITVNGNGHNVEDPNNPGTFSSSVTIKTNSQSILWWYDGTKWKLIASNASAGGYGVLAVNHSTPGTLTSQQAVASVDTSTGTTSVTAPNVSLLPSSGSGWRIYVVDSADQASANAITVNGGGPNIEDPNNPGVFASSITLNTNSVGVIWVYNGTVWKVVSLFPGPQGGVQQVVNGTPQTLSAFLPNAAMQTNTGTTVINLPPVAQLPNGGNGFVVTAYDTGGQAATNPITINGNGANVESTVAPGSFAASSTMAINWGAISYKYNTATSTWNVLSTSYGRNKPTGVRPILAGLASTQNGSSNPLRVGNLYFKPTDQLAGYKVYLRVVLETTGGAYQANIDLADPNNVLGNGAGAEVPGSLLQTVATTGTDLEVELNTAGGNLETVGGPIMLIARIWLTTTLAGQSVTCSHAALYVQ